MSDIEFIDGLIVKAKHENAPGFVVCSLSIKREELIAWLQAKDGDWVNADIKTSKGGRLYAAVNTFKPKGDKPKAKKAAAGGETLDDDIPF